MAKGFHVALLRAVNLGPHGKVAMADLRAMAEALDLEHPKTLLNSGNLVFGDHRKPAALETLLEKEAAKRLGLDTDFIVRTASEIRSIVKANPFPQQAKNDPGHLTVLFCKNAPGTSPKTSGAKREEFVVKGREVYINYPDGIGTSKFKIDAYGTARNWNTLLKISGALA